MASKFPVMIRKFPNAQIEVINDKSLKINVASNKEEYFWHSHEFINWGNVSTIKCRYIAIEKIQICAPSQKNQKYGYIQ